MKPLSGDFLRASRRLGFVLIVSVVLLGQGVSRASDNTSMMPITCKVMPTLEASFPESLDFGEVAPTRDQDGSYVISDAQVVRIWSNTGWALTMRSDSADGRMTKWTGDGYSSETLTFPLEWQVNQEGEFTRIEGDDITVAQDQSPTDKYGTALRFLFRQLITYNDVPLLDLDTFYRIEVTFTAVQVY
jgi:hypothetical protein